MSSNMTHRKRLARALAERTGLTYQQARNRVVDAAERGLLPPRLDHAGMAVALQRLLDPAETAPTPPAAAPDEVPRQRRPRRATGSMSNDDARQAVERSVHTEQRIADWFQAMAAADPRPVRWTWADPDDPRRDSLAEIDIEFSDGHHELALVADLADRLQSLPDPALAGGWRIGSLEPFRSQVSDARGRRVNPTCDVCDRRLADLEQWWLVAHPDKGWDNNAGVVCANHRPDLLPWLPEKTVIGVTDAQRTDPRALRREDLQRNLLVQTPANEVLKVSEFYDDGRVSAQLVYPVPPRTTVRFYTPDQVATWRVVSDVLLGKYERAWGFSR